MGKGKKRSPSNLNPFIPKGNGGGHSWHSWNNSKNEKQDLKIDKQQRAKLGKNKK